MPTRPTVLVVGAGIGGLLLGILLEQADIPYEIFERHPVPQSLDSTLLIGANILPVLLQIGLYDRFIEQATLHRATKIGDEGQTPKLIISPQSAAIMGGYENYIIAQSTFHQLLLSCVPANKIRMGKRVLKTCQSENGVTLTCSDNSTYYGHILVGADGTHSGVRQSLYHRMSIDGRLPPQDQRVPPIKRAWLVGQTRPMDLDELDIWMQHDCQLDMWTTHTTGNGAVCWAVLHCQSDPPSRSNDTFRRTTGRDSEGAETMCRHIRDFSVLQEQSMTHELTLGFLIDRTPKESLCRIVVEEERVFKTWYDRRIVLLGDACHQLNPFGGQGAIHAMHDAIALANWINVLDSNRVRDIESAFREYRKERHSRVAASLSKGAVLGSVLSHTWTGRITRYLAKQMPPWFWTMAFKRMVCYRPQAAFLPPVYDSGTVKAAHQHSLFENRQRTRIVGTTIISGVDFQH